MKLDNTRLRSGFFVVKFRGMVDECGEKNETELRVEIDTEIVVLR